MEKKYHKGCVLKESESVCSKWELGAGSVLSKEAKTERARGAKPPWLQASAYVPNHPTTIQSPRHPRVYANLYSGWNKKVWKVNGWAPCEWMSPMHLNGWIFPFSYFLALWTQSEAWKIDPKRANKFKLCCCWVLLRVVGAKIHECRGSAKAGAHIP